MGAGGPVFDLYRHIYANMTYIARADGVFSDAFTSDIGVLIGDPASPMMWNLFFADFRLPTRTDDIRLAGTAVSHLEHADDVILMSTSREGLQAHLTSLAEWAALAFVLVNVEKTWALTAGARISDEPFLHLNKRHVAMKARAQYVGIHLTSTDNRVLSAHYVEQRKKAARVAAKVFAVEGLTGALPVDIGLKVYRARVDPHLIAAADVNPDAIDAQVLELESMQHDFLRRLLGLGSRCCLVPLFSETGIWPIRYRRADIALRYLEYLRSRPEGSLVRCAMSDSMQLARSGSMSWYKDLQTAVSKLGAWLPEGCILTDEAVGSAKQAIQRGVIRHVHSEYACSEKLTLLVRERADGLIGRAGQALGLREYLRVERKAHRQSLTRFLTSNHGLAIETRRYNTRTSCKVDRADRRCRFCIVAVEDECHAVFECSAKGELVQARARFEADIGKVGATDRCRRALNNDGQVGLVQFLIEDDELAALFARHVHEVLGIYSKEPQLML
ncbi:hypothetical protein AURDEDRAFT_62392 [Auricularia subglabra TFB-10046 SS5]|nr:hypothetical protein AURDEDRAFT_62392 [Auricularia subglabra TFB-10046 SS5]